MSHIEHLVIIRSGICWKLEYSGAAAFISRDPQRSTDNDTGKWEVATLDFFLVIGCMLEVLGEEPIMPIVMCKRMTRFREYDAAHLGQDPL